MTAHQVDVELTRVRILLAELRVVAKAMQLYRFLRKFDPSQPRWPAGRSDGGQWRPGGAGRGPALQTVMGKWNADNFDKCEAQYEKDFFQCTMMPWNPFCVDQAISRRTACMKDDPIPDFFHVM